MPFCYKKIENENDWRHKLCGCGDNCGLFCRALWCPCVVFGQTAREVNEPCCPYGCLWLLAFPACWFGMRIRGQIREKHSINGTWQKDCVMGYFCGLCALVQEAQEVQDKKEKNPEDPQREMTLDDLEEDSYY